MKKQVSNMKSKVFNAYTAFVLGTVLLAAVTFVQLTCPACHGTGIVHGVQGLEITGVDATLVEHKELGMNCGWDWERYKYDVKVSVINRTTAQAWGVVMVNISNPTESFWVEMEMEDEEVMVEFSGETLKSYPIFVEVPPSGSKVVEDTLLYEGVTLKLFGEEKHWFEAVTASEFPCPFHGAKATVPFTEWLRLR
jgi:hypothetical protein